MTATDTLRALPDTLFEFTKRAPFGLLAEVGGGPQKATVATEPTYGLLSWSQSTPTTMLVPPLVRLGIAFSSRLDLQNTEDRTTGREECIWLYCYARAASLTGERSYRALIPDDLAQRWYTISSELHSSLRTTPLDALRATILTRLGFPGARLLRPLLRADFEEMWDRAVAGDSFDEIARAGLPLEDEVVPDEGSFALLPLARTRVVVHEVFGRSGGVLATTGAPWIGGREGIQELLQQKLLRPIMFENHNMDRPVAFAFRPHLHQGDDGQLALHATLLVTDEDHWKRIDSYKGFSVGMYHD